MQTRLSVLAPFRHGDFRNLWTATLASNLGGLIQAVGAGWVMTMISDSSSMVALVQASTTLPIMLFSLVGGALADSFDRRRIMLIAQATMMAVSIALAVCAFSGLLTPWLLLTFTFLIGCGTALHNPSWQASMGDLVPRADLPSAVALNSMGFNLMRSVGPAVGGVIVAVAGGAFAFAINACSYLPLIAALARWKHRETPDTLPREEFVSAIGAGMRYVLMTPNLLRVMARGLVFGFAAIVVLALLPLVVRDLVGGGALTYGLMLGCFGLGAIGGALANARLRERFSTEHIVRWAFVMFALSVVGLALSKSVWLGCLFLLPAGACWVLALSLFNTSMQLSTPRWVVGRSLSLYQTATFGGMAIGSWVWGAVAEFYGPAQALLYATVVLVAGALMGLRFGLAEFGSLDLNPLNQFREPELRLVVKPQSGPIMVMIDYEVDRSNVPDFLAAMADRRRIRLRDGAQQWALLRDLENPDVWTESYHVPTWVDYVRHNMRRTQADAAVAERLQALHRGEERPRVHRMLEYHVVPAFDDTPLKDQFHTH
nr:MFS transporter [Pseudochelatococcus lubricantis]